MISAEFFTSSKLLTTLTPPAFPLPPACIWALTTKIGPGNFSAAFTASSVVNATYPEGVGISYCLNNS